MSAHYPFKEIESRWQLSWDQTHLYRTPEGGEPYYVLVMFAYPSGDIHMGHFRNYIVGDAVARKKMMEGRAVLHPFGWDAFGLPAENAAIKRGIPPQQWTETNIAVSRDTLKKVGISYDWEREIVTCRPDYYRWNQWIFLKLFESGLAYRRKSEVNWCPGCKTVLANEQVVDGLCDRCGSKVEKRSLEQWFLRITAYAQRLLDDLDTLSGWPENVKTMQRNWIGRSVGLEVDFALEQGGALRIFTTRPDTIYGVTFMVLAPESELAQTLNLEPARRREVADYLEKARLKGDLERSAEGEKDGVFTGCYATNPFSGERLPIWVADYVLAGYGTGGIMAVPAHDERDFAFARKYDLPVRPVLKVKGEPAPSGELTAPYTAHDAEMMHSGSFDGLAGREAFDATCQHAEARGWGRRTVHFKLRDWGVSRQRYWGTPIPIIHCPSCGLVPVPESDLPVRLPEGDIDYMPKGRSPLEDVAEFINVACPKCQSPARRDPDTMDTFVDSSWYFLRYLSPHDDKQAFDQAAASHWLPIDKYIGGITHATGHLLYFRFVTKVLYDKGLLQVTEPAVELFNHGMVLDGEGQVMSKSVGNVVSPTDFMEREGVDVARLTMYFASPSEKELLWSDSGAVGAARFLDRLWRFAQECEGQTAAAWVPSDKPTEADRAVFRRLHQTIRKVTLDYDAMQFNTGLAALMELLNEATAASLSPGLKKQVVKVMVQLLGPLAPHFAEEVWHRQGSTDSVFLSRWPVADPEALAETTVTLAVQVNGKLRGQIVVPASLGEAESVAMALADAKVARSVAGAPIVKTIFVPGRLINFVVRGAVQD